MPKESAESVKFVVQATGSSSRKHSCLPNIDAPGNNDTVSFPAFVMSLWKIRVGQRVLIRNDYRY
jgi:hypothetical protein